MTGRELYEKWCEFAGDVPDNSWRGGWQPRRHWTELSFEASRAWDDLAASLDTAETREAAA